MNTEMQKKLKEKLDRLTNKSPNQDSFWKPTEGKESRIRIIPYNKTSALHPDPSDPFVELWIHYGMGKPMLCPLKNAGKPSPVQELIKKLYKSGTETDKQLAKQLSPKRRFFAAVIDRDDASMTPKIWGFSQTTYKTLLEHLTDADYANALDPLEGLDLTVTMSKTGGKTFAETMIKFGRKERPVTTDGEQLERVLNSVPDVEKFFHVPTYEEVSQRLQEFLNFNNQDADDVSTELHRGNSSEEDVDAAFAAALNKND